MSELSRTVAPSVGVRQLENYCLEKLREAMNSGATLKRLLLDRCGDLSINKNNKNNDCKYVELLVHNHCRKKNCSPSEDARKPTHYFKNFKKKLSIYPDFPI